MLCTKCGKEFKLGEIQCSSCGEYARIGKGSRAAYHLLTVAATIFVPMMAAMFGLLAALDVGDSLEDFKWLNWLLVLIPVSLVFNIIICTAMRRENWGKKHDIIKFMPCVVYAVGLTVSLLMTILCSAPLGMLYTFVFFGVLATQVGMLFIAVKVSRRIKEVKATYDEYYRQRKGKSEYKNLK